MAKSKKEDIVEENLSLGSTNALKSYLISTKNEHFSLCEPPKRKIISTGSLILDYDIKIRSGCFVRMCGKGAELGKTSESLVLAENFMKTMPNSKTLYIRAESKLSEETMSRSGLTFYLKEDIDKWTNGTVYVFDSNIFQNVASGIETVLDAAHKNNEHLCIILDSLDGLILREDYKKDLFSEKNESAKVAGVPLLTKLLFRRIAQKVLNYDCLFIIISQYSSSIPVNPYSGNDKPRQTSSAGGSALEHQGEWVFEYLPRWQKDYIFKNPDEKPDRDKNPIIGVWASLAVKKSATDVTGNVYRYPIKKNKVGAAIWVEKEVVDQLLAFQLITRSGAWFMFSDSIIEEAKNNNVELIPKIQGLNKLYTYVEEDKEVFNFLYNFIKQRIGI